MFPCPNINNSRRSAFRDVTNNNNVSLGVRKPNMATNMKVNKRKNIPTKNVLHVVRTKRAPFPMSSSQTSMTTTMKNRDDDALISRSVPSSNNPPCYQQYIMGGRKADNIDERDSDNPLSVADYAENMYQYFRLKERTIQPYIDSQPRINEKMRSILVDWLTDVHLKFRLVPETLYLTVNIVDRYLEKVKVERRNLQLLGVTCLLIASKYEELYPPEINDLVYICDNVYTRKNIIAFETTILQALEYRITTPSPHTFLVRYLKAGHADKRMVQISCYILDETLLSYGLQIQYLPSQLAAAAVFIARRMVNRCPWSPTLLKYTSYMEEEIVPIARTILAEKKNSSLKNLYSTKRKYSSSRYGNVADNIILECDF